MSDKTTSNFIGVTPFADMVMDDIRKSPTKAGERVLVILPHSLELVLWAVPVWQGFLQNLLAQKKEIEDAAVVCEEQYDELVRWHVPEARILREVDRETVDRADLVYAFDIEQAQRVTGQVGKSVSESFGIILGSFADRELPIVARKWVREELEILYLPRHVSDGGLIEWPHLADFANRMWTEETKVRALSPHISWQKAVEEISQAVGCVGVAGGLTLLAAAMERPVVELYTDAWPQVWQAKLEDMDYRMIYSDPQRVRADFVKKTLDDLMTVVGRRRQAQIWADTSGRKPILDQSAREGSSERTA